MAHLLDKLELSDELENQVIDEDHAVDIAGNKIEPGLLSEDYKEQMNSERGWKELEMDDLANMFGDFVLYQQEEFQEQLIKKDFNYEVFGEDYYAMKFPHFPPEIHEILAKVSKDKIIDLRKQNDEFKIEVEEQEGFKPFEADK